MATERRKKTLTYHRAEYSVEQPASINLGLCINEAFTKHPGWEQKTIPRAGGQTIRLAQFKRDSHKGYFLHLTFETPGESASIVPHPTADASGIDVSTASPPNDAEFMDADAFIYVRENHLCLCASGVRLGSIDFFLRQFFERSKIRKDACEFQLLNVSDRQKIESMLKVGVKKIDIQGTLYSSTVTYLKRKTEALGILYGISKHYKALFGNENDVAPDGIGVGVSLSLNRTKKGWALGAERMGKLAQNLIENQQSDDEFTIVLRDGKKITASEIVLSQEVEIDKHGKSVVRDEAWRHLKEFFSYLGTVGGFVE